MSDLDRIVMGYFPLWGATFDSDDVGIVGEQIAAFIPERSEWRDVEQSDVWSEQMRNDPQSIFLGGPKPPFCLVPMEPLLDDEDEGDGVVRLQASLRNRARDGVLALRLWKEGWFLDPGLAAITFRVGMFNTRLAGPYRQRFLGGAPGDTPPSYQLSIDELGASDGSDAPVPRLWRLAAHYRDRASNGSADIAVHNFHRSYGYYLSGPDRVAFLSTALDAMLLGMTNWRVRERGLKETFRDRVAAALRLPADASLQIEPDAEADWLDTTGREMRNAVAHGRTESAAAASESAYPRLRAIVRLLLRQYLEFSIRWSSQADEIRARFRLPPGCGPTVAFNRAIEASSTGEAGASELFCLAASGSTRPKGSLDDEAHS